MPVEGDVVGILLDDQEVRGRILELDGRTVSVAYDGHAGVLVATFQFALLGARFPRQAIGTTITAEGVGTAEMLLRELAVSDAFVSRNRPWLSTLIRGAAEELRREGAWNGALSAAELDAARRAIRADRRHRGLHQRAARARLRALEERSWIPLEARRELVRRIEERLLASRGVAIGRSVLYGVIDAEVPWITDGPWASSLR
jgi:hypothetical protein